MSKYTVTHTCKHQEVHQLFGAEKDRAKTIEWLKTIKCSKCYAQEQASKITKTHDIIEVKYSDYKNSYANNKTVPNSYNKETKTIKIYVKKR